MTALYTRHSRTIRIIETNGIDMVVSQRDGVQELKESLEKLLHQDLNLNNVVARAHDKNHRVVSVKVSEARHVEMTCSHREQWESRVG